MSDLSWKARIFILSVIAVGLGLSVYSLLKVDWQNFWLLILTGVAAIAQVYKVEGATHKIQLQPGLGGVRLRLRAPGCSRHTVHHPGCSSH